MTVISTARAASMTSTQYFKDVATQWDTMRKGFFSENVRDKAYAVAEVAAGQTAADLGAGTGFMSEGLVRRGVKVIAIVPEMLEVLSNKIGDTGLVECRIGESESLPMDSNSVNHAFANMYLHHVEKPAVAIKEMYRILKSGGKLWTNTTLSI